MKKILFKAICDQIGWRIQLQQNIYEPMYMNFYNPVEIVITVREIKINKKFSSPKGK